MRIKTNPVEGYRAGAETAHMLPGRGYPRKQGMLPGSVHLVYRLLLATLLAALLSACGSAPDQAQLPQATPPTREATSATSSATPAATRASASATVLLSPTLEPPTPISTLEPPTPTEQPADQGRSATATPEPSATRPPQPTPTRVEQPGGDTLASRISAALQAGTPVVEIADPGLRLPDDIHPLQIKKYFQLGEVYFGLVLRGSMNIVLNGLPDNGASLPFTGVLVSDDGASWRKQLRIHDAQAIDKNNPYYLWTNDGGLYLSIVDQNGAGSGEGGLKVARLAATGHWELVEGCYYFVYNGSAQDGDYFAYSQYLSRHEQRPAEHCSNVRLEPLP